MGQQREITPISKITSPLIQNLRYSILQCPQFIPPPNMNGCIQLKMPFTNKAALISKCLLLVLFYELHNDNAKLQNKSAFEDAYHRDNKIIINDTYLRNIIPLEGRKMSNHKKIICRCENYIQTMSM